MTRRLAILASGEGTTAESFIRAAQAGQVTVEPVLVICNKQHAGIFERIDKLNREFNVSIETQLISSQTHPKAADEDVLPGGQTAAEEAAILQSLGMHDIDYVLLLGYLRRVGARLVQEYGWRDDYISPYQARMLNSHPGLLPETAGLWGVHVQEHVIERGLPFSGQTFHVVAQKYDDGPVIAEHQVPVESGETAESLMDRVKNIEKQYLPVDMQAFMLAREQLLAR